MSGFEFDGLAVRATARALRRAGIRDESQLRELLLYRPDLADEMLSACGGGSAPVPLHSELCDRYGSDPVGFFRDVLREYVTPECVQLLEAVASHDCVAGISANAAGKSWTMGGLAWWGLLCHSGSQVYCLAAGDETNLRRLLWSKITARLERRPGLLTCLVGSARYRVSDLKIQRYHQHHSMDELIEGVIIPQASSDELKQTKTSGKHAPFLMFLVDEADGVPDAVFSGIETCMSGGRTHLVCSFNPKIRSGYVYQRLDKQFKTVRLSAFGHPNVQTGRDVVPGAVSREITVRRMWQMSDPVDEVTGTRDGSCYEVPSFLVGCDVHNEGHRKIGTLPAGWRKVTDPLFAPMVLGKFSAVGDARAIFNRQWLSMLQERLRLDPPERDEMSNGAGLRGDLTIWHGPEPRGEYIVSADPAEGLTDGDWSVADVWHKRTWEQVAQYRGHPDPGEFAGDLASIGAWYNGAEICVERNNHGHAVLLGLTQLQGYDDVYRHDDEGWGYPISEKSRIYLIGKLVTEFNASLRGEGRLKLNSLQTVEECLNYVRLDRSYGAANGFHDDCVSSLRLGLERLEKEDVPWKMEWKPPEPQLLYGSARRHALAGR